jgi:urea transport system permease protein
MLVNYAKTYFTTALPEAWYYALGALFILVTLFLPRGIIGLLPDRARAHKKQMERLRIQVDRAQPSRK